MKIKAYTSANEIASFLRGNGMRAELKSNGEYHVEIELDPKIDKFDFYNHTYFHVIILSKFHKKSRDCFTFYEDNNRSNPIHQSCQGYHICVPDELLHML